MPRPPSSRDKRKVSPDDEAAAAQDRKERAEDDDLPAASDDSLSESEVDENYEAGDYIVDAIAWAEYVDTRRTEVNGYVGWKYMTLWSNYLKSGWDTLQVRDDFDGEGTKRPMVDDFWKGVGKPIMKGRKEPGGRVGEVVEAPPRLLKRWFRRSNPRRSYPAYVRRRAKELAGEPIQRRDSDHYINKKRIKLEKERQANFNNGRDDGNNAEAGPSGAKEGEAGEAKDKDAEPAATNGGGPASPAPSHGSSLYSLFSDSETDDEEEEEVIKVARPAKGKRRRIIGSPDLSPRQKKKSKLKEEKREQRRKEEKRKVQEVRDERSRLKAEKLAQAGRIKKRDPNEPIIVAPPAPDHVASLVPIAPPPQPAPTPAAQAEPAPPSRTAAPPSPIVVASSPPRTVPVTSPPRPVPPASAPSITAPTPPTSGQTNSIFGAADEGIFGGMWGAPDQTPPANPAPLRRVNQEPLFDFGDTYVQESPAAPLEGSPLEVSRMLLEKSNSPAPEPEQQQQQAPPVDQQSLSVASAPEELPSSTPINQISSANAPSLMLTEATPMKDQDQGPASSALASSTPSAPEPRAAAPTLPSPTVPASANVPPKPPATTEMPPSRPPPQRKTSNAGSFFSNLPPGGMTLTGGASTSGPLTAAEIKKLPPSQRPKYVQPKAVKTLDAPLDPERNRKLPVGLPARPNLSPLTAAQPLPDPSSAVPTKSPVERAMEMKAQEMKNQRPGPGHPPANQWKRRQQQNQKSKSGGRTPPHGGKSPTYGATGPGGKSPVYGGQSPAWGGKSPIDGPYGGKSPMNGGGRSPVYNAAGPGQFGMAPAYPQQQQAHLPPAVYEEKRDPRKRGRGGAPANGAPHPQAQAAAPGPMVHPSRANMIATHLPQATVSDFLINLWNGHSDVLFKLALRSGATTHGSYYLEQFANSLQATPRFEEIDRSSLELVLAQSAEVIEWGQVGPPRTASTTTHQNWEQVQRRLASGRLLLCIDEIARPFGPVNSHLFVVIATAADAHLDKVGLNGHEVDKIGSVAIVVSVPIHGDTLPNLPNPVRPDFYTGERPKGHRIPGPRPANIAESYGLDSSSAQDFRSGTLQLYPSSGTVGIFSYAVEQAKRLSLQPPAGNDVPGSFILVNSCWEKVIRSGSVKSCLPRHTQLYAMGPDFGIPVANWTLQEIWKTGGLVTFSPTFILRSPDKFAEIVEMIRSDARWAAYVLPSMLLWCEESWEVPQRCPEPSKTFATLTSALFMDDNLRQLASSNGSGAGGLAVSYCPPPLSARTACVQWMDWLRRVFESEDWKPLLALCREAGTVQHARKNTVLTPLGPGSGNNTPNANGATQPLDLGTVELDAIRDLIAMRSRPHIVPYRRYIYIGSLSNRAEAMRLGERIIEFVDPADFEALLSGSI